LSEQKSMMPRVSVVMSVYNDADRVEHAVRGVLAQDFHELELIVVNDGSSDASGVLLDRLAAEDARLHVVHQQNAGLTRALIRGCADARGELIARQDSDDWSHPQRISEQVALLDSDPRIGFVSCATEYIGPGNEHLSVMHRPANPDVATRGLLEERQGPPAHGSVMFRKSLYETVGGYRPEFHYSQDSDLWLRMAEQALIAYLPEVRYIALREIEGASGAQRPIQRKLGELSQLCRLARLDGRDEQVHLRVAREISEGIRSGTQTSGHDNGASLDQAYLLGSQLARNRDARARAYLWKVLQARPWHMKAWIRMMQTLLGNWLPPSKP